MPAPVTPVVEAMFIDEVTAGQLGPSLWLDASKITGVVDGAAATTFIDRSGHGRHGTQSTGAKQALWIKSAVNGKPALRFDGINDGYNVAAAMSALLDANAQCTIFAVIKPNWASGIGYIFSDTNTKIFTTYNGTNAHHSRRIAGPTVLFVDKAMSNSAWHIVTSMWNESVPDIYVGVDNTDTAGLVNEGAGPSFHGPLESMAGTLHVGYDPAGSASSWPGDFAELIIYPTALSEANRRIVERYLYTKYAITDTSTPPPVWTDITTDILYGQIPKVSRGIQGDGPTDLVAPPGQFRFEMDNSNRNSASTQGYYSLDNANVRTGWALNIPIRLKINGTVMFYGQLDSADPIAGKHARRTVACVAMDYMKQLENSPVTGVATLTNTAADACISAIVSSLPVAPTASSYDVGSDPYPYALDTIQQQGSNALSELAKIVQSEQGKLYVKADGTLRFEKRSARYNPSSSFALTESNVNVLSIKYGKAAIRNRIRVTVHPRRADTTLVTLFSSPAFGASGVLSVPPGTSVTIQCPYTDPTNRNASIGGTNEQALVAGTDYVGNTRSDGAGATVTSDLSIALTPGGGSAKAVVTNAGTGTAFYTLRVQGFGLYTYQPGPVTCEAVDTGALFTVDLPIDMPYISDVNVGQGIANQILAFRKALKVSGVVASFWCSTAAQVTAALAYDIGTAVSVTETIYGTGVFFINGVDLELRPARGGVNLYVSWHLAKADETVYAHTNVTVTGSTDITAAA